MVADIAYLQQTQQQISQLETLLERQRQAYRANPMPDAGQRIQWLKSLANLLVTEQKAIIDAINSDFSNRSADETLLAEVMPSLHGVHYAAKRVKKWMKPSRRSVGMQFMPASAKVIYQPLGVVGVIVPWNFPMPIAGWGFAPALAAGNTVVLKPAEITPLTAIRLGELALEAGLPEGVFTVIAGKGSVVGDRFVTHPAVRKVCFTGSTEVGKQIMAGCADQVKRVTLELGGKSANIVFADADIAKAAAAAPYAVFDNAGQDCCARSRILVQRSALDDFMAGLETSVHGLKVMDPSDPASEMGPLVSAKQKEAVDGYLDGVDPVIVGSVPSDAALANGYWSAPTVVLTTDASVPVWREEVFGPIVAVMPFDDEADAIRLANDTEYGLSGSIYTRDVGRAVRVARAIESGNLSVNSHSSVRYWTPFGGFKQSGLGRELGPDAPNAFTEEKNVFIATEGN